MGQVPRRVKEQVWPYGCDERRPCWAEEVGLVPNHTGRLLLRACDGVDVETLVYQHLNHGAAEKTARSSNEDSPTHVRAIALSHGNVKSVDHAKDVMVVIRDSRLNKWNKTATKVETNRGKGEQRHPRRRATCRRCFGDPCRA